MWQRLLGGEAMRGVGMEKGTDEVLGCDVLVGLESQISTHPHKLRLIPCIRIFVGNLPGCIMNAHPRHCCLSYHFLHAIGPE